VLQLHRGNGAVPRSRQKGERNYGAVAEFDLGIYGIDMETGKEGEITSYPTPEELWKMTFATANAWRDRFAAIPSPDKSGTWTIRYYQETAVNRVLEAIEDGRDRILLRSATAQSRGTGGTGQGCN
jgi:type I site-specific restriction endonuclease